MGALLSYFLVSQAEAPGADDQDGRGQADERRQQKDHQEDQESGDVQNGLLTQLDGAVDDEGAHAGPHAGQGILDPGIFRKGPEEGGNDQHDEDGREQNPQGGEDGPPEAVDPVATEGRCVHGNDAGGTLGHGGEVEQLLIRKPLLLQDQLPLKKGEHGVATAEAAGTDAGKGEKKF